MRRRKGASLVELLLFIVVASIIGGGIINGLSSNTAKANKDAVTNELMVYEVGFNDAFYDLGAPEFDPANPDDVEDFKDYIKVMETEYLSLKFDENSITPLSKGFRVSVAEPLDVYGCNYVCYFITAHDVSKCIMLCSGGADGRITADSYASQGYGDDIVLVSRPET